VDGERNTIAVDDAGDIPVLVLGGEWDLDNADVLRATLSDLVATGVARIVVDLSGTAFLDSTAMQAFVSTMQQRVAVTVRGATGTVLRTLLMAGMDAIVDIEH